MGRAAARQTVTQRRPRAGPPAGQGVQQAAPPKRRRTTSGETTAGMSKAPSRTTSPGLYLRCAAGAARGVRARLERSVQDLCSDCRSGTLQAGKEDPTAQVIELGDTSDDEAGPADQGAPAQPSGDKPWWHRLPDFVPVEALRWGTNPRCDPARLSSAPMQGMSGRQPVLFGPPGRIWRFSWQRGSPIEERAHGRLRCRDGSTVHVAYADQFSSAPAKLGGHASGKASLQRLKDSQAAQPGPSSSRPGLEGGRWITEHCGARSTRVSEPCSAAGHGRLWTASLRPPCPRRCTCSRGGPS